MEYTLDDDEAIPEEYNNAESPQDVDESAVEEAYPEDGMEEDAYDGLGDYTYPDDGMGGDTDDGKTLGFSALIKFYLYKNCPRFFMSYIDQFRY